MSTCSFPSVYVCFEMMSLQLWYEWDVTILDFHKEPKHKNDFLMIQFNLHIHDKLYILYINYIYYIYK